VCRVLPCTIVGQHSWLDVSRVLEACKAVWRDHAARLPHVIFDACATSAEQLAAEAVRLIRERVGWAVRLDRQAAIG
jgi:hypothetical protein